MPTKATNTIAASTKLLVDELHHKQERVADEVASIVDGYWKRLATVIASNPTPSDLIVATRLAHQAMAKQITKVFGVKLKQVLDYTHEKAVDNVLQALPKKWMDRLLKEALPVGKPSTENQKKSLLKVRIFSPREVNPGQVVAELIADTTHLGDPQAISSTVNLLRLQGKTSQQIAKAVKPMVYDVKSTVRRVVRDTSQFATTAENLGTWNALPKGMVLGYQVHAVPRTKYSRPEHLARSGTIYYVNPKDGQKGLSEMPQPPYDVENGRMQLEYNCRCYLSPVFAAL